MMIKNRIIFYCLLAIIISALTETTSAQKRVEVKGSVNCFLVSENGFWGIEIDRMYVLPLIYKSIKPVNGKYFIVENKSSRMGICNTRGKFIFPCKYAKVSIDAGVVELYDEIGEDPKYFHISDPYTELDPPTKKQSQTNAIAVGTREIENKVAQNSPHGTYLNFNALSQSEAVNVAIKACQAAHEGAFQLQTNKHGKQELIIDNKIIFTSSGAINLITDANLFHQTKSWFFIVCQNPTGLRVKYGVLMVSINNVNGKKVVSKKITIPMEHSSITPQQGNRYWIHQIIAQDEPKQTWLKCSVWGQGIDMRNIYGKTPAEVRAESGSKFIVNNICSSDNRLFIKEVIVGEGFTEVIMDYTHSGDVGQLKIDTPPARGIGNLYFIATHNKNLPMRAIENYSSIFLKAGSKMTFSLIFSGLPNGCTHFDLFEGENGKRNFSNIKLIAQ